MHLKPSSTLNCDREKADNHDIMEPETQIGDRHGINGSICGVESNIVRYDGSERKNI